MKEAINDQRQALYLDDGSGNLYSVVQEALPDGDGLWISDNLYLERQDVQHLKDALGKWLETGRLFVEHNS